jgi:hypothetical protein
VVFCVFLLDFGTVGTVSKSNKKTKKYHTVGTVPKSNQRTKKYHTVGTVSKSNQNTKNTQADVIRKNDYHCTFSVIEVPVPSHENEPLCICRLGISILSCF